MPDAPDAFLKLDPPAATLRTLAVDRIRAAIIAGHFASGQRLVERTLCAQLGVSRSVVREAIRYLEAEGLVQTQPRSGPVVATLDWAQAAQIYTMRRLLEADAAATCARVADDEVKDQLRRALATLEAAFAQTDAQHLLAATTQFYQVIFIAAGQDLAWDVVQRLNGRISRLRALTLSSTDRHVSGAAHMRRICAAICANDADSAAAAVNAHLRDAAEIARLALTKG
jgi:GntR family transcriptional regulator, trigonelline degradation regulator